MLGKDGKRKTIKIREKYTFSWSSFLFIAYVKATFPLLYHRNKVFNLKSILATSQHRWRAMILLTSPWLLWNLPPFSALARVLLSSSSPCLPVLSVCVPPVSGVTRHFSWDAILIAVLRLKRLLRFAITLRRVHRIFCSRSEFSIFLAEVLPGRTKLIRSQIIIQACIINASTKSTPDRASFYFQTEKEK